MIRYIEAYLASRFAEIEKDGFHPMIGAPCSLREGVIRAFQSLEAQERLRYRRIVAHLGALNWLPDHDISLSSEDHRWWSSFSQSWYPLREADPGRQLAKARDLRRVAKLCFDHWLGQRPRRSEGNPGDWICDGVIGGCAVSIELRYGCTMTQVEYGVRAEGMRPYTHVSAERLYGLGLGWWDRVYIDDVDQAFALMRDLIKLVVDDHLQIMKIIRENA